MGYGRTTVQQLTKTYTQPHLGQNTVDATELHFVWGTTSRSPWAIVENSENIQCFNKVSLKKIETAGG